MAPDDVFSYLGVQVSRSYFYRQSRRDRIYMRREMRRMRRDMRRSTRRMGGRDQGWNPAEIPTLASSLATFLWRFRSELAPAYSALFLYLSAWLAHDRWQAASVVFLALVVLAAALVWTWRRIDRNIERWYAGMVAVSASGWWAGATISGPSTPPFPTILIIGGTLCAIPWWAHHRRRSRVRVSRDIEAWPGLAENAGMAGSRVVSAIVDAWGYTARVALRRGMSARAAIGRVDEIASMLGVKPRSVRVTEDPHRADHVIVRVMHGNPLDRPVPWPGHLEEPTITRPIPLGVDESGAVVTVLILRRNVLVGGVVGSGKSGVLNVFLSALVAAPDVIVWGIDLKGGMELAPWAGALARLATGPEDAVALLSDAVAEMHRRTRSQAERGDRLWKPSREHPALVIVVDEFAELPSEAVEQADSLARLGRAVAVNLLAATQRPTQDAMGHGAIRSQMDVRISLRVREKADGDLILGAGAYKAGWRPDMLTAPGSFLVFDPEHVSPYPARAYWLDDATVATVAAQHPAPRPLPPVVPSPPDPPPDPELSGNAVLSAMRSAGPDGLTVSDLMNVSGRSRRWVYYELHRLIEAGHVERTERGRWRARPDDVDRP